MVPTLNYPMGQLGGSVHNVLAGILKRNLYEIVQIDYFRIKGVPVFVTFMTPQAVNTVDVLMYGFRK